MRISSRIFKPKVKDFTVTTLTVLVNVVGFVVLPLVFIFGPVVLAFTVEPHFMLLMPIGIFPAWAIIDTAFSS